MRFLMIGLLSGLAFVAIGRRLRSPADDLITAASAAAQRGDHDRAADLYQRAATRGVNTPALAHNHGAALYHVGRLADAEERYQHAGGAEGRDARAAYDRGNCLALQACPAGESLKPELLLRAMELYRTCLQSEDARHNLELVKVLLSAPELTPSDPTRPTRAKDEPDRECPS